MKIWILTTETPFNLPGGIARYVHNFATYLGRAGHSVVVFCRAREESFREIAPGYRLRTFRTREMDLGLPAPSPEADAHPSYPYNLLFYWMAVSYHCAEVVRELAAAEGPPDVIESQDYTGLAYFLLHRRLLEPDFLPGVPVVLHLHSPDFILRRVNHDGGWQLPAYWIGRMERYCLHAADARICPSRAMAREVQTELDEPSLAIETIPLPWSEGAQEIREEEQADTVCYLGRIEARKGVIELLQACDRLWRAGATFRLRLIGGTTHYAPANRPLDEVLRARYPLWLEQGRLEFTGHLEHGPMLREVARAAVVVIPSLWENFPNTCIEAMSLGKTVVASRHGGQVEMIGEDGEAGFLFDWGQPGQFEERLQHALALSPAERARIGAAARRRIGDLCAPPTVLDRRLEHFTQVRRECRAPALYPFVNRAQRLGLTPPIDPALRGEEGLVSAIIPYYNLGEFVEEALDSVLRTTYRPLEVLIVNDGSTDPASLAKLEEIRARRLPEVRILDFPNGGLSRTRNRGAEAARGEFLLLVDSDDAVEPELAGQAVAALRRFPNVHWVYPWVRYFGAVTGVYSTWNCELPYLLAHNMLIPVCLVRRGAFLAFGRNKPGMVYGLEDYESWVAMMEKGCGGLSLPRVLARYRVRQDSMFRALNRTQLQFLHETIVAEHPDLYRQYGPELFNLQNANGPGLLWSQPACWIAPIEEVLAKACRQEQDAAHSRQLEDRLAGADSEVRRLSEALAEARQQAAEAAGRADHAAERAAAAEDRAGQADRVAAREREANLRHSALLRSNPALLARLWRNLCRAESSDQLP